MRPISDRAILLDKESARERGAIMKLGKLVDILETDTDICVIELADDPQDETELYAGPASEFWNHVPTDGWHNIGDLDMMLAYVDDDVLYIGV